MAYIQLGFIIITLTSSDQHYFIDCQEDQEWYWWSTWDGKHYRWWILIVRCQVSVSTRTKDEETLYLMHKLSRLANTDASCDYGPRLPISTPRIYTALSHVTASTIMVSTSTWFCCWWQDIECHFKKGRKEQESLWWSLQEEPMHLAEQVYGLLNP